MTAGFQYDAFLSHNAADQPQVRQLAERLQYDEAYRRSFGGFYDTLTEVTVDCIAASPAGTSENSPAFQRWEPHAARRRVPSGTAEAIWLNPLSSLTGLAACSIAAPPLKRWAIVLRPDGLGCHWPSRRSGFTSNRRSRRWADPLTGSGTSMRSSFRPKARRARRVARHGPVGALRPKPAADRAAPRPGDQHLRNDNCCFSAKAGARKKRAAN